jgi:hypothetical protein
MSIKVCTSSSNALHLYYGASNGAMIIPLIFDGANIIPHSFDASGNVINQIPTERERSEYYSIPLSFDAYRLPLTLTRRFFFMNQPPKVSKLRFHWGKVRHLRAPREMLVALVLLLLLASSCWNHQSAAKKAIMLAF